MARRYPDFPIVLETYRECLRDVLDLPGLRELLRGIATREVALVEVETQSASPFAGSLLFDYVATYMYEGDTPSAERRAAALSLDRELLRELLGQEEMRELIDPAALAQVEDDLQRRSERTQATSADALCDVLRAVGDLRPEELAERVLDGVDGDTLVATLERERRAVRVRIAGEERVIASDDAGLYRDALGVPTPGGVPEAFLADVPDALTRLIARWALTHGPFTTAELRERYGVDVSSVLRELERAGALAQGELRPNPTNTSDLPPAGVGPPSRPQVGPHHMPPPGASTSRPGEGDGREWCDIEVLRRLRRASLASLRKEIEPVEEQALTAFMPSWQGVGRWRAGSGRRDGVERLREVLVPLQGLALPVAAWERDVLPARTGSYSQAWLDTLCASGEVVWVGAGSLGRDSGRVALYFREDTALLGPPAYTRRDPPGEHEHVMLRERLAAAPCFFSDLLTELDLPAPSLTHALWDLVWAGEVTNDAWAPLRAPRLTLAAQHLASPARMRGAGSRGGRRFGGASLRGGRLGASAQVQGRWSTTARLFGAIDEPAAGGGSAGVTGVEDLRARRRALAELLLERYGVLTREQVLAEGIAGGFSAVYGALCELETLGVCRRGYFVEGLGGAQFALPGAVERLRARSETDGSTVVLAAVDPAQPYGATLPWPRREGQARRPARVAGSYVVFVDSVPSLYLERGGRGLVTLADGSPAVALQALAEAVRAGDVHTVALERVDGKPAIGSALEPLLVELGFRQGPRKLTLRA